VSSSDRSNRRYPTAHSSHASLTVPKRAVARSPQSSKVSLVLESSCSRASVPGPLTSCGFGLSGSALQPAQVRKCELGCEASTAPQYPMNLRNMIYDLGRVHARRHHLYDLSTQAERMSDVQNHTYVRLAVRRPLRGLPPYVIATWCYCQQTSSSLCAGVHVVDKNCQ
jgi:hypothetical protein